MTDQEIIVAVAEKVMGWKAYPLDSYNDYRLYEQNRLIENVNREWVFFPASATHSEAHAAAKPWNPLESVASAWMVVENLAESRSVRVTSHFPGWRCVVMEHGSGDELGREVADTAPRAICLAALKAIEASA